MLPNRASRRSISVNQLRLEVEILSFLLLVTQALAGCKPKATVQSTNPNASFQQQFQELYDSYLKGDAGSARQCLLKSISLVETAKLPRFTEASELYLTYSRLCVLDKWVGNIALANSDFLEVKHWYVETKRAGNVSEDDVSRGVAALTPETCEKFIEKWDRDATAGRGPVYLNPLLPRNQKTEEETGTAPR